MQLFSILQTIRKTKSGLPPGCASPPSLLTYHFGRCVQEFSNFLNRIGISISHHFKISAVSEWEHSNLHPTTAFNRRLVGQGAVQEEVSVALGYVHTAGQLIGTFQIRLPTEKSFFGAESACFFRHRKQRICQFLTSILHQKFTAEVRISPNPPQISAYPNCQLLVWGREV